jgi:hypothetical protein
MTSAKSKKGNTREITLEFSPGPLASKIAKYGRDHNIKDDKELLMVLIQKGLEYMEPIPEGPYSADELFDGTQKSTECYGLSIEFANDIQENQELWTLTVRGGAQVLYKATRARPEGSDQPLQFGYTFE